MDILHEKCEKDKATDKKLPTDSFLVTYKVEDEIRYDVTRAGSVNEIFDHYYDKYKKALKWLKPTQGTVRPNLWNQPAPKRKKRKKPSATPPEAPSS